MITALLTIAVLWLLFHGTLPSYALALICAAAGLLISLAARHKHAHITDIDVFSQVSRLNGVNPALKFWSALTLMIICVSAQSPAVGLFLTVLAPLTVVFAGGLNPRDYAHILALPFSFLMVSGLALLLEITVVQPGGAGLRLFGLWFAVTDASRARAAVVLSRALGAVSCLFMLSLTTPMSDLIGVLRRARMPGIIIDIMYLTYRYIFILLSMHHTMQNAAKSRLGYCNYGTGIRTTGCVYSNMLFLSFRRANRNFDAMESRCYDKGIRFLENNGKIKAVQVAYALAAVVCALILISIKNGD